MCGLSKFVIAFELCYSERFKNRKFTQTFKPSVKSIESKISVLRYTLKQLF